MKRLFRIACAVFAAAAPVSYTHLYTDAQHSREDKLDADMVSRVPYLKMRIAYEAGR